MTAILLDGITILATSAVVALTGIFLHAGIQGASK